jgi:Tat protein translocase TatC
MPFLEHLEELRVRLTRIVIVLIAGFGVGYWVVQRFQVVTLLKEPITPFLTATNGKLVIQSPTESVMIVLKLALIVGLILTSPVILYQIWAFLSPALYAKEKRTVLPAVFVGLLLFISGSLFAFFVLLPQALPILFSFQSEGLENLITFSEYFSFVTQLVLAMGLAFELPLVIIMLTALGVTTPRSLNSFRRYAIVLAAIAGAVLSPGTDILSMLMMTVPILLLYEVGYAGSWLVHRARRRKEIATAAMLLLLFLLPSNLAAQQPTRLAKPPGVGRDSVRADSLGRDSLGRRPNQALDTAAARRLGLPTQPRQQFPPEDSVLTALMNRPGYQFTRFRSDSAVLFAGERRIQLNGAAMTKRGETLLEADTIGYQEADCQINAVGNPSLFDRETVLSGFGGIKYNTCIRRGIVTDALTSFKQGGSDWFLRGNLAQDSSSSRLFASKGEITSCDLPTPHYHFSAREVKWISKTIMVARPAVLYMRDVPVLWLPFVFQDARPGRRSGILIPRFGLNDIVRQNPGYDRQVTNIGYYWAPNDYFDATAKLDWYANRYVEYGAAVQYRVLDRFLSGTMAYSRMSNADGGRSTRIRWSHIQNFNISTSLNMALDYSSDGTVRRNNSINPLEQTQQINSQLNFQKKLSWGTLSIGGIRRQNLSDKSVTLAAPTITINPKPIDLARNVTWSPALTFNNNLESNFPISNVFAVQPGGSIDTVKATFDRRTTSVGFQTPLRIGGFNWANTLNYNDRQVDGRTTAVGLKIPDLSTSDPTDSIVVNRVTIGDFQSDLDWQTGINLPTAFRGTWKFQPSIGITNTTSGPFLLRNANTNGDWVAQGKRFSFGLSSTPTFFGFFPGFGPLDKIRHSVSPTFQYSYSPSADVPEEFARALAGPGGAPIFRSDQVQRISIGLSQNFEGKMRKPASDTSSVDNSRKLRLLGISTSSIQYDFEQAKKPGRTGWLTDNLSNQLQSDLLPGFSLSLTHDLFRGPVGTDSATFSPFLQAVTASFAISGNTVKSVLGLFGIGKGGDTTASKTPTSYVAGERDNGRPPTFFGGQDQRVGFGTNRSFSANFNYSLNRTRPENGIRTDPQQSLGFSTAFAPTPFWTVSWSTQYNITDARFESQTVRLERVLHEWRAGFNFVKAPNGNFAFYFSVFLSDLPDIKFDYNQTSIER